MPVYDIFTRRRDPAAGQPEVYVYDKMPESLVNQIIMIWNDVLPDHAGVFKMGDNFWGSSDIWEAVESIFTRERGIRSLVKRSYDGSHLNARRRVQIFFENTNNNDHRLDLIDLAFQFIWKSNIGSRTHYINELNQRFKLAGVGYQFVEGKLIRMDSTVAHEEIVKPALVLLSDKGFEKANEEYRSAHDHYRRGEHAQTVSQAGRAFESALKAICTQKGWQYSNADRASDLVKVVVKNGLFPEWMDKGVIAYTTMISTGLPGVRNNAGAHGTAPDAAPVLEYLARYALHLSAANMLMVAEAACDGRSKNSG